MLDELEQEMETDADEQLESRPTGSKWRATLVNGKSFYLGNRRFDALIPQIVSGEEADQLERKHTLQSVLNADETITPQKKPRFKLEGPISDDGKIPVPEPVVRTRTRPSA